jgi:hypothetical protein
MFQIQGQVVFDNNGWLCSIGIPTFFLDKDFNGIKNAEHALIIAKSIVDSGGRAISTYLTAYDSSTGEYARLESK